MPFRKEPQHRHGQAATTAVLLVNLGTPDAPTAPALRRYLAEFLSDPRVVEIPRLARRQRGQQLHGARDVAVGVVGQRRHRLGRAHPTPQADSAAAWVWAFLT